MNIASGRPRPRKTDLILLVDRCLAPEVAYEISKMDWLYGLTLHEHYDDDAAQQLEDVTFLAEAGQRGWGVLTQNPRMWQVPQERACIIDNRTRVFSLDDPNASKTLKGLVLGRHFAVCPAPATPPGSLLLAAASARSQEGPRVNEYDLPFESSSSVESAGVNEPNEPINVCRAAWMAWDTGRAWSHDTDIHSRNPSETATSSFFPSARTPIITNIARAGVQALSVAVARRLLTVTAGPIKATGADTGGAFALAEFVAPAGDQGPPAHVHHRTGEAFFVLDGTLIIRRVDEQIIASAGSFVYVRPGQVHTYAVSGAGPARFIVNVDPPELIRFFQEMVGDPAAEAAPGGHDIELVEPPASWR